MRGRLYELDRFGALSCRLVYFSRDPAARRPRDLRGRASSHGS